MKKPAAAPGTCFREKMTRESLPALFTLSAAAVISVRSSVTESEIEKAGNVRER